MVVVLLTVDRTTTKKLHIHHIEGELNSCDFSH
ncbi:hypothetical protein Ab1vBOLIVR4_gp84 [Agrobacterium phage OLIVR4]|nr:hypothetical protein Ab1vBOLIVR4_gp84 [Agrobacterium phage OLIVR4]